MLPAPRAASPLTFAPALIAAIILIAANIYYLWEWHADQLSGDVMIHLVFARNFADPRNFDQLLGCLDRRIDETLRGLGDVPSGDTHDLAPLVPCAFEVAG